MVCSMKIFTPAGPHQRTTPRFRPESRLTETCPKIRGMTKSNTEERMTLKQGVGYDWVVGCHGGSRMANGTLSHTGPCCCKSARKTNTSFSLFPPQSELFQNFSFASPGQQAISPFPSPFPSLPFLLSILSFYLLLFYFNCLLFSLSSTNCTTHTFFVCLVV